MDENGYISQWITDRLLENVDTKYDKEVYYNVYFKFKLYRLCFCRCFNRFCVNYIG